MQQVEPNSIRTQRDIMVLVYHECWRTFGDRLLMPHDRLLL